MSRSFFSFIFSAFLLCSLNSQAQVLCEALYQPRPSAKSLNAILPKHPTARFKAQIQLLAESLILKNADSIMNSPHGRSVLFEYDFRGGRIQKLEWVENSSGSLPLLNVYWINLFGETTLVPLRTNGQIAFLDRTYLFRDPERAKKFFVAFIKDSKVEFVDQGSLILESLPANVQLSRSLSDKEKEIWLKGDLPISGFGPKLHFGLNEYWYRGQKPFLFRIEKRQLLEAYREGRLEINTYDSTGIYAAGEKARTNFGLEVEFVLVGKKALKQIAPLIQTQLLKPPMNP